LLKGALGVIEFLNADMIARGLSPFDPESAAMAASEVMLQRMDALAEKRISFGLETTLAARSLAPRIRKLIEQGYEFHLVFLWLPSADMAVARVADRVRMGGHDVPETTIRRRYRTGLSNFFELYHPLATSWRMYDNSRSDRMKLIATGGKATTQRVALKTIWQSIRQEHAP
jgi:predicted ABC-type ATPase